MDALACQTPAGKSSPEPVGPHRRFHEIARFCRELEKHRARNIVNLCAWCPAHAALETGRLDAWVQSFCEVAHARAAALL